MLGFCVCVVYSLLTDIVSGLISICLLLMVMVVHFLRRVALQKIPMRGQI